MMQNINGKIENIISHPKTSSPTGYSGATNLPPINDSFMYMETIQSFSSSEIFFFSNLYYNLLLQHIFNFNYWLNKIGESF